MKKRTKRAILLLALFLVASGGLFLWHTHREYARLRVEGVEIRGVLTSTFTRRTPRGHHDTHHRGRKYKYRKTPYFTYRYDVGGRHYEGEVRKQDHLHHARVGDSVRILYLPDRPSLHQLVRDSSGRVVLCRSGRR